jgi:hypothetical protein
MLYHFPTPAREESMDVSELGIIEIAETPPLDLTPMEIEALAETLLQYHADVLSPGAGPLGV